MSEIVSEIPIFLPFTSCLRFFLFSFSLSLFQTCLSALSHVLSFALSLFTSLPFCLKCIYFYFCHWYVYFFLPSFAELGGSTLSDCKRKFLQQASLLGKALQDAWRYGWKVEDNGDNNKTYILIHSH